MIWNSIFIIMTAVLTLGVIYFGGLKKAFCLMVFLLPATGFYVDVGFSLLASRIVGLTICLYIMWAWLKNGIGDIIQFLALIFLVYAAVITTIGSIMAPSTPLDTSEFRVQMRPYLQWMSLSLSMLPVFATPIILTTEKDILATVKAFWWGTGLLAIGGLIQWFVYWAWGINIFPIYREGLFGTVKDAGLFMLNDSWIFRANSFAREPKDMAVILLLSGIIWLILKSMGVIRSNVISYFFLGIVISAALLSFATTGIFMLVVGMGSLVVGFLLKRLIGIKKNGAEKEVICGTSYHQFENRMLKLAVVFFVIAISCTTILLIEPQVPMAAMESISGIWSQRVVDRVGNLEEYDMVVIEFLKNEPQWALIGVGGGNLPRYGFSFLPNDPSLLGYMMNPTWDAKAGLLKIIGSYGIVGVCIIGLILWKLMRMHLSGIQYQPSWKRRILISSVAIVLFVSIIHAGRAIDDYFWLTVGIAAALARLYPNISDKVELHSKI